MITACILSTGTELLLGDTMDTNSYYLARRLTALGIQVTGIYVVGDDREMLARAFKNAMECADIVISSGGMGPTLDDLSREVVCEVLGVPLQLDQDELLRIQKYFELRGRKMPEINKKQAMFPAGSVMLPNSKGTAAGFWLEKDGKTIILLPGPPREMEPMFEEKVEPRLKEMVKVTENIAMHRTVKTMGLGESQVEERIKEIIDNPQGCSIALLAKEGEVHLRISRSGESKEAVEKVLRDIMRQIRSALGDLIYSEDESATLPGVVVSLLAERKATVATAESCTGGLLAKLITDIAGSSRVFWGGVETYSNESKARLLGVKEETLNRFGAVSPETASEMAIGMRKLSGSSYAISITGIAGPEGGTEDKPVGLVYIGMADEKGCETREFRFLGGRDAIRMLAAKSALDWLRIKLIRGES